MSVLKVCEQCKKEFAVPNRRHESVKFCSRDCKTAAGWVEFKCTTCGTGFKRKRSDNSRSEQPYCSRACYEKSLPGSLRPRKDSPQHFKVCQACGGGFSVIPYRKDKAKWCSRECRDTDIKYRTHQSEQQQGEKSWRWAGGTYQFSTGYVRSKRQALGLATVAFEHRMVILQAMLDACPDHPFLQEADGKMRLRTEIEVHHIDRKRSNNELSNLLAVTKDAHAQIHHRGKKPEPWECWPSHPVKW